MFYAITFAGGSLAGQTPRIEQLLTLEQLYRDANIVAVAEITGAELTPGRRVYEARVLTALKGANTAECIYFRPLWERYALNENYLIFLQGIGRRVEEPPEPPAIPLTRFPSDAPLYRSLLDEPVALKLITRLDAREPVFLIPARVLAPKELSAERFEGIERAGGVIRRRALVAYLETCFSMTVKK